MIMRAAVIQLRPAPAPPEEAAPDVALARAAGRGDRAAFETLYERHHLGLLSFCRHMLGQRHDAEDVVQHTFFAADRAFRSGQVPKAVRAWLYTVARNRCVSLLRTRRDERLPADGLLSTESLDAEVERREELRDLLADLRTLPDDQRAALLLAELGDLSHAEVAAVLGVRTPKVKALVFQARSTLAAASDARAIPCLSIRRELESASGSAQRRRHLRDHLDRCEGCRTFHAAVRRQRAAVASILPVAPSLVLREAILAGLGAGAAGSAAAGGAGFGALAAKLLTVAAIGGAAAGGGTLSVRALDGDAPVRPDATAPAGAAPVAEGGASQPAAATVVGAGRGERGRRNAPRRAADPALPPPGLPVPLPAGPAHARAAPPELETAAPPPGAATPPAHALDDAAGSTKPEKAPAPEDVAKPPTALKPPKAPDPPTARKLPKAPDPPTARKLPKAPKPPTGPRPPTAPEPPQAPKPVKPRKVDVPAPPPKADAPKPPEPAQPELRAPAVPPAPPVPGEPPQGVTVPVRPR